MSKGEKVAFAMIAAGLIGAVVYLVLTLLTGCSPAQTQHRIQEGTQQIDLAACIATAKLLDAGHDERMAAYNKCADLADAKAGKDGGP